MAFELTINGKTQTFATGEEMAAWMERMKAVTPKPKRRKTKRTADKKSNPLAPKDQKK